MTKLVMIVLLALGMALAQQEAPPQVEGFPAFSPPVPMFTVLEETEDGYRLSHEMGETLVPKNPQRIVALDIVAAEVLISLGVQPVGLTAPWLPEVVAEAAPEMTFLLTAQDLNLEAVLALGPDLIIGRRLVGDDPSLYEQLSRIAPTVVVRADHFSYWQQYTYDVARLLGISERAEEVVQDYEEQVANYRERARAVIGEEGVNIAIIFPQSLLLYGPGYLVGDLYVPNRDGGWPYHTLGLNPSPEAVELLGSESFAQVSFEILPQLTAEHLIILYDGAGTADELSELETTLQTFTDHPLWRSIRAVQEGNVYVVATDRPCCYYSTLEVLEQFDAVLHAEAAD